MNDLGEIVVAEQVLDREKNKKPFDVQITSQGIQLSLDLDGTLIDENGKLNKALLALIRFFHAQHPDKKLYITTHRSFSESCKYVPLNEKVQIDYVVQKIKKKIGIDVEVSMAYSQLDGAIDSDSFFERITDILPELKKDLQAELKRQFGAFPSFLFPEKFIYRKSESESFFKIIYRYFEKYLVEFGRANSKLFNHDKIHRKKLAGLFSLVFKKYIDNILKEIEFTDPITKNLQIEKIIEIENSFVVHLDDGPRHIISLDEDQNLKRYSKAIRYFPPGENEDPSLKNEDSGLLELGKTIGFEEFLSEILRGNIPKSNLYIMDLAEVHAYCRLSKGKQWLEDNGKFLNEKIFNYHKPVYEKILNDHKPIYIKIKNKLDIILKSLNAENNEIKVFLKRKKQFGRLQELESICKSCTNVNNKLKEIEPSSYNQCLLLIDICSTVKKLLQVKTRAEKNELTAKIENLARECAEYETSSAWQGLSISLTGLSSTVASCGGVFLVLAALGIPVVGVFVAGIAVAGGLGALAASRGLYSCHKSLSKSLQDVAETSRNSIEPFNMTLPGA